MLNWGEACIGENVLLSSTAERWRVARAGEKAALSCFQNHRAMTEKGRQGAYCQWFLRGWLLAVAVT